MKKDSYNERNNLQMCGHHVKMYSFIKLNNNPHIFLIYYKIFKCIHEGGGAYTEFVLFECFTMFKFSH